ncbi:MAG: FGGY family carbohydrate kinase, partial [Bacillota bacterium]
MNAETLCLAIDQGTHARRALVVDERGTVVAQGERAIGLTRPHPDWAEQDGDEVVESIFEAAREAIRALGDRRSQLVAAGLT